MLNNSGSLEGLQLLRVFKKSNMDHKFSIEFKSGLWDRHLAFMVSFHITINQFVVQNK